MPRHVSWKPSIIIPQACLSPVITLQKALALGLPPAWVTARDCASSAIDLLAIRAKGCGLAGTRPGGTGGTALEFGVLPTPASLGVVGPVGTRQGDVVSTLEIIGVMVGCGLVLLDALGTTGLVAGVAGGAGLLPASPFSPGVVVAFSLAPRASIG